MITFPANGGARAGRQSILFWVLRLATYFVLACATYIFLDIGIKGSRTLFTRTAPFINLPFLSESPQTLLCLRARGEEADVRRSRFS